jgi:hypothetical protein
MTRPETFTIGSDVSCTDESAGELRRVVVDPVARAVTHLVVEAKHRRGTGRLVPVDLVESTDQVIRLRCTVAEFADLEEADETRLLPTAGGMWGYGREQVLMQPYYAGFRGMAMGEGGSTSGGRTAIYDRIPVGEVQVRRGESVHATDGTIGRVQGLVIDPMDHHVTHVLLDEGHLWGKKRVAIPITAVADVDDGVRLTLSKDDVRELPEIDVVDPE